MAGKATITILRQPGAISSAYRPIIFKVKSTVQKPELQFRGVLYGRNDITKQWDYLATKYEKRYMGNDYFIFNFANILQTLLSFDRSLVSTDGGVTNNMNSIVEYMVLFTEVYYDAEFELYMTDYNTLYSDVLKAVNAIPQHEDSQTMEDYILPSTGGWVGAFSLYNDFSQSFK